MSAQGEGLPLTERLLNQIAHVDLGIAARFPDITGATKELLSLSEEAAVHIQSQVAEIERLTEALRISETSHAAARQNFITMQGAAAALVNRIEVKNAALGGALHYITNIDNSHPVVRQIRSALAAEGREDE